MPTFADNFLKAYAIGTESKARQERLRLEEEQQALQRQQLITQMQRIDEDRKVQGIQRQQQDVLDQLTLMERVDRPTIPAGDGVGPPAPAEVQPLQFPLHGGGKMPVTPLFRGDVLEAERAKKESEQSVEIEGAVAKARALAPIQMAVEEAKGKVVSAETIYVQRQMNARQAKALEAEAAKAKDDIPPPEFLESLLQASQRRSLDLTKLGVKTYNELLRYAAAKGEKVPRQFTAEERKNADRAAIGLASVLDMERFYKEDPNVVKAAALPTSLGRMVGEAVFRSPHAEEFEAARKRATDPELRIATGAALNNQEQKFYGELQAGLFNDPEAVKFKLNQLKAMYAASSGLPMTIRMPDGKEFRVVDTSDFVSREKMRQAIRLGGEPLF